MFYMILAAMVLVALAFVLWPLFRSSTTSAVTVDDANLDALRAQRAELDSEHAAGHIDDATHARAVDELALRLSAEVDLHAASRSAASATQGRARPWALALWLCAFIATGSVAGYAALGNHAARQAAASVAATGPGNAVTSNGVNGDVPMSDQQILAMVEGLAQKMEQNPNDARGWILLARSQSALGQFGPAIKAFERAVSLMPDDANLLSDFADTLAMSQDGNLAGKPTELMLRALKVDPKHPKALALAGTAAMRAGDKKAALGYWHRLKGVLPPGSEDARQVAAIIEEINTGKPAFPTQAVAEAPAPPLPPASAASPVSKATPSSKDGRRIQGSLAIAPALRAQLARDGTLFIFARAVDGPRMPLAVLRVPVPGEWPYRFELTDAMAMAPGMNLSSAKAVWVEARISKTGNAQAQPGDLAGSPVRVDFGNGASTPATAQVSLDKVFP